MNASSPLQGRPSLSLMSKWIYVGYCTLNLAAHPLITRHPPCYPETELERRAWECSPESSRQLVDALRADPNNDVAELGRPIMLAEAIIYDRCLGTVSAAAVIESLGGWQGDNAGFVSVTRQALNKAVVKAKADVKRVSWYEPADVDGYLKSDLKDLAARKKLERKNIPTKKRGTRVPSPQHPAFFLSLDAPIYFYRLIFSVFHDLCSGAVEPEEPDSEWAAAVSSATDSQGCMAGDEEAARILQEFDKGNFAVMTELAAGVAAVDAVAAAEAEEKRAAAQSAAAKAANKAAAAVAAAAKTTARKSQKSG